MLNRVCICTALNIYPKELTCVADAHDLYCFINSALTLTCSAITLAVWQ